TEAANDSFGITLGLLREGRERVLEQHHQRTDVPWVGDDVMYFETGQGSALSAEAHHGVDQQTLEARAYAVARAFDPFLVNSVVGFIGPEYLSDGKEIIRAGWRTISAASCSDCRWAAMFATPITRKPIRTIWTP